MRESNPDIIYVDNVAVGIYLPGDFCCEHECGIKSAEEKLGLKDKKIGIEKCKIHKTDQITFIQNNDYILLACGHIDKFEYAKIFKTKQNTFAEWDMHGFVIIAPRDSEIATIIDEIHNAIMSKDAYIMLGSQGPFVRTGINLGIISRLPQDIINKMRDFDIDYNALEKAWVPVKKRLDEMLRHPTKFHWLHEKYASQYNKDRLMYCALSPKQLEPAPVEGSKYPFKLWLNPDDQSIYQSDWYTVEEIEQWANGEGPVIQNSRFFKVHNAFDEWQKDPDQFDQNIIPYYHGICPKCSSMLHFGNGPDGDVDLLGEYSNSRLNMNIGNCPKCGARHCYFLYSDYHRRS